MIQSLKPIQWILVFGLSVVGLSACQSENSNSPIQKGKGPNPSPNPKPTLTLSNRVMLTLAGLSDLHEILRAALSENVPQGCLQRGSSVLTWACAENSSTPAVQTGTAKMDHQADALTVLTDPLTLKVRVRTGQVLTQADRDIDLKVRGGRVSFLSSYTYVVPRGTGNARYRLLWQIDGQVSGKAPDLKITNTEVLLTVFRTVPGGRDTSVQYRLDSMEQELAFGECGQVRGGFAFKGFEQEELAVLSDGDEVKSPRTTNKHKWAPCGAHSYHLKVAAPFWRQPEP